MKLLTLFKKIIFTCFLLVYQLSTAQQLITTIAGGAIHNGENGLATQAQLLAQSISIDGSSNIYIADIYDYSIRKINAQTGIITTLSGLGSPGFSGDNEAAIEAQLDPIAVVVDLHGDVYVADVGRIRKIAISTGIIETVAGNGLKGNNGNNGNAINAQIDPRALSVDNAGNIYLVEGNQIRKVNSTTGIITLVAGAGIVGFSGDNGPATNAKLDCLLDGKSKNADCDKNGNLYIADYGNNRIRKVDAITNIITTIAGNGSDGYSGDGGLAINAQIKPISITVGQSNALYFLDGLRIRKINLATGIITTIAGDGTKGYKGDNGDAMQASFSNPSNLATDTDGNLYVVDENRIRKINSLTGIITTVAGIGKYGYTEDNYSATNGQLIPFAVVFDKDGNLIFNDGGNRIRKINSNTGVLTTLAGNGNLGYTGDNVNATMAQLNCFEAFNNLAADKNGNIYIADRNNLRIRKVSSTGIITTLAGVGTYGYSGDNGLAINAKISYPSGVAVDAIGNVYFADTQNHRIRKVDPSGVITTLVGTGVAGYNGDNRLASSAQLYFPLGVTVDHLSNLYIVEVGNRIRKVDSATGTITTIAGTDSPGYDGDGSLAINAKLNYPTSAAVDQYGNVYIADQGNNKIRKINANTGVITTLAGYATPGFSGDNYIGVVAQLYSPTSVSVDSFNNLYFTDLKSFRIRKIINASNGTDQHITFDKLPAKKFSDIPFNLTATTTSVLPIAYNSSNLNVATVVGNTITIAGVGQTLITASQGGDANYNSGTSITQLLTIEKADQLLVFDVIPTKVLGDAPFSVTASTNTNLPITYSTTSDKIVMNGNIVTLAKAGSATINAKQEGNSNYNPVTIFGTFCVNPNKPSISSTLVNPTTWLLTSSNVTGNQWFLNGNLLPTHTEQTLTITDPAKSGNYTVKIMVDNCVSEASMPYVVSITGDIGYHNQPFVGLYPNPVNDKLTLELVDFDLQKKILLQVMDLHGKTIESARFTPDNTYSIDISTYISGTYICTISQGQKQIRKLFVKP